MNNQEAIAQAFENGRKKGDAEGYARGLKETVRHGQWFRTGRENVYGGIEIQCSECGHTLMTSPGHIDEEYFCCHCGANMRGEGDG